MLSQTIFVAATIVADPDCAEPTIDFSVEGATSSASVMSTGDDR